MNLAPARGETGSGWEGACSGLARGFSEEFFFLSHLLTVPGVFQGVEEGYCISSG